MKMPDFLMVQSTANRATEDFTLGETGFALDARQRPPATLTPWISGDGFPDTARNVLEGNEAFRNISGLIRVPTESDAAGQVRAEWILGRASSGLVSIVVRDSGTCEPDGVLDDTAFAIVEAKRYCAASVVVLVQEAGQSEAATCRAMLQKAFGAPSVESNVLYPSNVSAELPVWFASLSASAG